jgi:uncharacterized protein YndB with AHSA1/START domain
VIVFQKGKSQTVIVEHFYETDAETVFDAWLDPELFVEWMFSPDIRPQRLIEASMSPVVGGGFRFRVERNGKEFTYTGQYLVVDRPNSLQMTWSEVGLDRSSLISVQLVREGAGCRLTVRHALGDVVDAHVRRIEEEWRDELASLARTLH